ncbi:hypothetical protein ABT061_16315 [Streptosporangium sp. NPDC002544]
MVLRLALRGRGSAVTDGRASACPQACGIGTWRQAVTPQYRSADRA